MAPSSKSLTLPCGTVATVTAFNGRAQGYINDVIEATSEKQPVPVGWQENLYREVVRIDSRVPSEEALLALPSGSRLRLLVESRRLTYGDTVTVDAVCRKCGAKSTHDVDLGRLVDVPYPEKLAPHTFTTASGAAVTIGWGTGRTERAFSQGRLQKMWKLFDEPLVRVQAINGEAKGPRYFAELDVPTLEEIRKVGRAMVPRLVLNPATDAPAVPSAGITESVEVQCTGCPATMHVSYGGAEDFLLRGAMAALD